MRMWVHMHAHRHRAVIYFQREAKEIPTPYHLNDLLFGSKHSATSQPRNVFSPSNIYIIYFAAHIS